MKINKEYSSPLAFKLLSKGIQACDVMKIKNKNIIKNKKAVGTTLTWFVGFVIIFFIIVLFVLSSTVFAGIKKISFRSDEIRLEEYSSEVLGVYRDLIGFLNSRIEFRGEEQEILDAIFSSLDIYFETKSEYPRVGSLAERYGFYKSDDISTTSRNTMMEDGFKIENLEKIEIQNRELISLIVRNLKLSCDEFFLLIPQGVVSENGLLSMNNPEKDNIFEDSEDKLGIYTSTASLKFIYRGQSIEIKFRELREC